MTGMGRWRRIVDRFCNWWERVRYRHTHDYQMSQHWRQTWEQHERDLAGDRYV